MRKIASVFYPLKRGCPKGGGFQLYLFLVAALFFSCGPSKESEALRSLEYYHVQSGSRGPVAWKLEAEQKDESIQLYINICTDFVQKKLNRILLATCKDTTEAQKVKTNFARAVFKGDRCVMVLSGNSYRAFNIYTGETLETEKEIAQKFPQLKNGVSAVDYYGDSYNIVSVKDVDGKLYYYDNNQTLLFNDLQKYWVDSLVNRESGGSVSTYNRSELDSELLRVRVYSFPSLVLGITPEEKGFVTILTRPVGKEAESLIERIVDSKIGKALGGMSNQKEIEFLDFNCNNNFLWMYSNGKKKFAYGVNLSEGKEIADLDLDTLFTFEEIKK